jgi:hypothetical protein
MCKTHRYTLFDAGVGAFFPGQTAAILYRRNAFDFASIDEEEDYYTSRTRGGDLKRNLKLLLAGDIYYMEDVMSAHRVVRESGDSWSARMHGKNRAFEQFVSSIELRQFAKKYYHRVFYNHYSTFRAAVKGISLAVKKPSQTTKDILRQMYREKHGALRFYLYTAGLLFPSIPLMFCRHILARRRYLTFSVGGKNEQEQ